MEKKKTFRLGLNNRWTATGSRIPFGPINPFIRQEGIRTQWDNYGVGLGLTDDVVAGGGVIKDAVLTYQDANAAFTGTSLVPMGNNFVIGARDGIAPATSANFRTDFFIQGNTGNVGIGTNTSLPPSAILAPSRLTIRGAGNLAGTHGLQVLDNLNNPNFIVRDDGFVGVGTTGPLPVPFNFNQSNPAGGWFGGAPYLVSPKFSLTSGDIETDGNFCTSQDIYIQSDSRIKKNINILYEWEKILNISAYSFNQVNKAENQKTYGFIAQDVLKVIPELTATWRGGGAVNYIGFIPFLLAGLQDHHKTLDNQDAEIQELKEKSLQGQEITDQFKNEYQSLQTKYNELERRLAQLEERCSIICSESSPNEPVQQKITDESKVQKVAIADGPELFQNEPNPFSANTNIRYYLPQSSEAAYLRIVNTDGKLVQLIKIQSTGHGTIELSAEKLPSGMYNYSLVVSERVVDSKRMTLIK